jgi:PAS domain-containing protein
MLNPFRPSRRERELEAVIGAVSRSQAVIEFRLDGTVLTANENFPKVSGYSPEEIVGRHHSIFVEPSYRDSPAYGEFWATLGRAEFNSPRLRDSVTPARGPPYRDCPVGYIGANYLSGENSNWDFAYGLGSQVNFGPVAWRVEYVRVNAAGNESGGDPDMLSVGVSRTFL